MSVCNRGTEPSEGEERRRRSKKEVIQSDLPVRLRQRNNREFFSKTAPLAPGWSPGGRCECSLTPTHLRVKNMHTHVSGCSTHIHTSAGVGMYCTDAWLYSHTHRGNTQTQCQQQNTHSSLSSAEDAKKKKCRSVARLCLSLILLVHIFTLMASTIQWPVMMSTLAPYIISLKGKSQQEFEKDNRWP